jgi:cbb3-type cytochrome oxidase cytochrome c subunit
LSNGLVPWLMYAKQPEKTAEQMVTPKVMYQLRDLAQHYPDAFKALVGEPKELSEAQCAKLLREGKRVYVGEGCWHCHSQFVRPVSNEERRWGPVSASDEYQNELQRPVMFGTRRVGPDLTREGGRRSNDWHVVHFFRPRLTVPESVMPDYPWLFDGNSPDGPGAPNRRGFAILTYIQWLGTWRVEDPAASEEFYDRGGPR